MASSNPVFLIVPGAWHQPEAYDKLVSHLQEAGHSSVVSSLPSCDSKEPKKASCSADADAARKQLLELVEADGKDVVVVCHSYGGVPAGGAASGLSKTARTKEGKKGGVLGLVYMTAFVVPEKASLLMIMGGRHAPYVEENQPSEDQCSIKDARNVLFNDLDDHEAEKMVQLLRPTSLRAFDTNAPQQAWTEHEFAGKLGFIRCMKDQALPPHFQDMFIEKSSVEWRVKDIDASHSPFASKPKEVVKIVEDFAQLFGA